MNNYKKISVVNEFNENTKEWDIKTIVIFRDGESPIIENYDAAKHLNIINKLVEKNGFSIINGGFNEAVKAGLVNVVARTNNKEMSALNASILQEQIKYGSKKDVATKEENKDSEETVELSKEDRELAEYFRKAILRDRKQLPPVGLKVIEDLAKTNERVAALEEAKKRLDDGRLSREEYDRIHSTYRAQLAEAIKQSSLNKKRVEVATKKTVEFNETDKVAFEGLLETIDLCRDARVNDEKFEVVIDRGLNDRAKREVRVTLTNGIARDSYNFEFTNGEVFDSKLGDILYRASLNDGFASLQETPVAMNGRTSDSISLFTTKGGNQVLVRYSVPKETIVLPPRPIDVVWDPEVLIGDKLSKKPEQVEQVAKNADNYNPEAIFGSPKEGLNLSKEDRELADYFRKSILRDKKQLPPVGLRAIDDLARTNERVAALEEAKRRLNEGKLSKEEFEKIHDIYRAQLAEAIKQASKAKKAELENSQPKKLVLSKEDSELADYLRKRQLRERGQLPPVGLQAIEELAKVNERVAALEEATKRLNEGKLSKEEFARIHDTYRAQLAEAIKKSALENSKNAGSVSVQPQYRNEVVRPVVQQNNADKDNTPPPVAPQYRREVVRPFVQEQHENNKNVTPPVAPVAPAKQTSPVVPPVAPVAPAKQTSPVVPPVAPVAPAKQTSPVVPPVAPVAPAKQTSPVVPPVAPVAPAKQTSPVVPPVAPVAPAKQTSPVVPPVAPAKKEEQQQDSNKKTGKPTVAPIVDNKKKPAIDPSKPVQTKGKIQTNPTKTVPVKTPDGKVVKVKPTSKLKQFGKYVLAAIGGIAAWLGIGKAVDFFKNQKVQHNQNQTQTQLPTNITNDKELEKVVNYYFDLYSVPKATQEFIHQDNVMEFLSQYTNTNQVNEVLSALCYGYEANILTTKEGNFRLDEDGNHYLRSFTSDFLCAKVVVNNYTPEQMLAVFGNTNVTYEQIMDGFKSYLNTVSLYGTTATEALPFRYLTNNDAKTTEALNGLFDKLSVVNANRKAGTLNSYHTDAFIVEVDKLFVQNDQSLGLTEGAKTVAAALVDSYLYSQAQVSNGEALYLHADYGLAKAGLNLQEVDGRFAIVSKDGTAYHFTSLLDVVNLGYGNEELANSRCLSEKQLLMENLSEMHELTRNTSQNNITAFANILYQNGLKEYADEVSKGNVTPELLAKIESANPGLAEDIDDFEVAMRTSTSEYIPFQVTVNGVDNLLGIKGLQNNIATLHNIRRNMLYLYNDYDVVTGKRYTKDLINNSPSTGTPGIKVPKPTVTTTVTQEQVDYEDLTPTEQQQAQEQVTQLQQQEQQQHEQQEQQWEEGKDELREAVAEGATQEELEDIADDYGITLDPNYQQNMQAALQEQAQGEQLAEQLDEEYARRNEEARRAAEERAAREAEEQAARRAEQEALINGTSTNGATDDSQVNPDRVDTEAGEETYTEEPSIVSQLTALNEEEVTETEQQSVTPELDQTDANRVDTEAGEEVYVPDYESQRAELTEMRDALTSTVDVEGLDLEEVETEEVGKSK